MSIYETEIWEELSKFRAAYICGNCSCGGVKELNSYFHSEYIVSFFMGLNSFAQIRSQLLLRDPIAAINKFFPLLFKKNVREGLFLNIPPEELIL